MVDDPSAQYRDIVSEGWDEWVRLTPLSILVLGPTMDEDSTKPSAALRREIYALCSNYGHPVKGELKELISDAKSKLGAGYDLCLHEIHLADKADAIIIIPDSPGSFAELGLFALEDEICAKTLVLFDKSHKKRNTFLAQGPERAYTRLKATVERVSYDDTENVLKLVAKELQKRRADKIGRRRRSGRSA